MCGGSTNYCPAPRFVHRSLPVEGLPAFPSTVTQAKVQRAFPELFEFMVVHMFVDPQGYKGILDDEADRVRQPWYALTWGCIHYHALYYWRDASSGIRWNVIKRCFAWVCSLGRERVLPDAVRPNLVAMAFLHWFPLDSFETAIQRLIDRGFLRFEKEVHDGQKTGVYYPTEMLARRLIAISKAPLRT